MASVNGTIAQYSAQNVTVVKVGLKRFTETEIKPLLINVLKSVAQRMVNLVDGKFMPWPTPLPQGGDENYPVWYGQMHDATGVAVYDDGRVIQYLPTKKALDTQPQTYGKQKGIIGNTYLKEAVQAGVQTFAKGLWIVMFCAVPYAAKIEAKGSSQGRGAGFFTRLTDDMFEDVLRGLDTIKPF